MSTSTKKQGRGSAAARRAARLAAVQALYQIDLVAAPVEATISEFQHHRLNGEEIDPIYVGADQVLFADLVRGASERRADTDGMVAAVLAQGWTLDRLEVILRCILRAGTYELLVRTDVPARVSISEYVDVAHAFFAGGEPGFVNGVLDKLARQLRPDDVKNGGGAGEGA